MALLGQATITERSLTSTRFHQAQWIVLVLFATFTARRQIAHIVVSADLLQRELRLSESRATSRPSVTLAPIHCMPKFAELSVRTSSFGSIPASTNSWTDLTDCNLPGSVEDEVSNQPYRRTEGCFTSVSTRRLRSCGGFPAPAVTHLTLMPAYCPFQELLGFKTHLP